MSDSAEPITVLLVEDNETDIFVIREALARCPVKTRLHIARDGEDALSYINDFGRYDERPCPALLLLDLNVPKVPGVEVLRRLRNSPRCNRVPVVVVTSSDSEAEREVVRSLGADAYFRKPTDLKAYMNLGGVITKVLSEQSGS